MIVKDLVADQSLSFSSDGHSLERSYLVTGIGGTPESKLYTAMTTAGIPQYNDPHPIIPDVVVTKITARPEKSGEKVNVTVSYSIPDVDETAPTEEDETSVSSISVSTGLTTEQVWRDINGELMFLQWSSGLISKLSYKAADVQKPQLQVSFTRTESAIPKDAIANVLGKINSVPWSGFRAKTWLCTQINATEDKSGFYNVDYGFSYNPNTWRNEAFANLSSEEIDLARIDPENENGYAIYDVYFAVDFNILNLSF